MTIAEWQTRLKPLSSMKTPERRYVRVKTLEPRTYEPEAPRVTMGKTYLVEYIWESGVTVRDDADKLTWLRNSEWEETDAPH
jgi:hypothetical protein